MATIIEICEPSCTYLTKYGWHFNKTLCDYAVSLMTKNGKLIEALTKDYVDKTLELYGVHLVNNVGYDYLFVANMCKADYYGSSIVDEKHFVLYIKDTIDDEDTAEGTTMKRWMATMKANNITINLEEFV